MSPVIIVLIIVVGAGVPVSALLLVRIVGGKAAATAGNDPALAGALVTAPALYGGGDGPDLPAIHGTGALGLTRGPLGDELVFVLAVPRREIRIPAAGLTDATIERTLQLPGIYRRTRRPWLVVRWTNPSGLQCAAGFVVAGPEKWAEVLVAAARSHGRPPG